MRSASGCPLSLRRTGPFLGSSILRSLETSRGGRQEPALSLPTVRRFWSTEEDDGSNEPEELRLSDNTFNGPVVG